MKLPWSKEVLQTGPAVSANIDMPTLKKSIRFKTPNAIALTFIYANSETSLVPSKTRLCKPGLQDDATKAAEIDVICVSQFLQVCDIANGMPNYFFLAHDSDLRLMTLTFIPDTDILQIDLHAMFQVCMSLCLARRVRQAVSMVRQTETQYQNY